MNNIFILLENPKYPGNIGMVCRLIANFDLPPLRIIGEKKNLHFEMEWMAYNSTEELSKIEYFSDHKESISDLNFVIGTGMIRGKNRVGFIPFSDLPQKIVASENKKFGLVFGREDRGLSNVMIDLCDHMIDFQLPGKQPSMNLSQSVSFVLGCIYSNIHPKEETEKKIENLDTNSFYNYVQKIFIEIGMNRFHGHENLAIKRFKKIIDSSSISREDLGFLYKIFQKIESKFKYETHQKKE